MEPSTGNDYPSSFFGSFRIEGFPTLYADNKTAAHVDILEAGFVLAFIILTISFLIILPSSHQYGKVKLFTRIAVCLVIGGILTTLNFGYQWEVGSIVTNTAYKAGSAAELHSAKIAVHFGLRGVNITLYADEHSKPKELKHEIIDYNEQFDWTWDQGRFGFGPYAGRLQRQFREGQRTGLPLPILWIADYLTLDGEGYRFGRFYRTAGWYAHIAMWTAFPCWLLAVILLHTCVRYGALLLFITGLFQIIACILWVSIRNPHPLVIPFENATLTTSLGSDFYLVLINGIFCLGLGTAIWILDQLYPDETSIFFGVDPLTEVKEEYFRKEDLPQMPANSVMDDKEANIPTIHPQYLQPVIMRRKTTIRRVQEAAKTRRNRPTPKPRVLVEEPDEEEQPVYGNQQVSGASYNAQGHNVKFA